MSKKKLRFKRSKLDLSTKEKKLVEERLRPSSLVLYEAISEQGRHEMVRPFMSLLCSGITAGVAVSLSVIAKALLDLTLPETMATKPLWLHLGYAFGFIVVILGRMQLFTENTVTPILPLLVSFHLTNIGKLARLWGIVFLANVIGTIVMALAICYGGILTLEQIGAVVGISEELLHFGFFEALFRSMPAGFLIACIVWLLPAMIATEIWVIIALTFLMSLGGFPHIIVGSTEVLVLLFEGHTNLLHIVFYFYIPVVLGNIIGGTGLFALLAYGQVRQEISSK